jgi:hypothetical protein
MRTEFRGKAPRPGRGVQGAGPSRAVAASRAGHADRRGRDRSPRPVCRSGPQPDRPRRERRRETAATRMTISARSLTPPSRPGLRSPMPPVQHYAVRLPARPAVTCMHAGCHTSTDPHVSSVHDPARLPVHDPGDQLAWTSGTLGPAPSRSASAAGPNPGRTLILRALPGTCRGCRRRAERRLRARSLRFPSSLSVIPVVAAPADGWLTYPGGRPRYRPLVGAKWGATGIRPHGAY